MKNFIFLLQVLFIWMKLTNQIDWNWILVLIPILSHIISAIATNNVDKL